MSKILHRIYCPVCGGLRDTRIILSCLKEPHGLEVVVQEIGGWGNIKTEREPIDDDLLEQLIDACDAALEHLEAEARRRGMQID